MPLSSTHTKATQAPRRYHRLSPPKMKMCHHPRTKISKGLLIWVSTIIW